MAKLHNIKYPIILYMLFFFIDTNKESTQWILKFYKYIYHGKGEGTVLSRHLVSIRPDVIMQDY